MSRRMARVHPDESCRPGSALTAMIDPPRGRSRYRCQSDRIFKTRSGSTPSFVRRRIKKRWVPPIPSCIVNCVQTSVSLVTTPTGLRRGFGRLLASRRLRAEAFGARVRALPVPAAAAAHPEPVHSDHDHRQHDPEPITAQELHHHCSPFSARRLPHVTAHRGPSDQEIRDPRVGAPCLPKRA